VSRLVVDAETQQRLRTEILQDFWRRWQYQGESAEKCSELASKFGRELERWWTHHEELLAAVSEWQGRWRLREDWCKGIAFELVLYWANYGEPVRRDAVKGDRGVARLVDQGLRARVAALSDAAMAAKPVDPRLPAAGERRSVLALPGAPASDWSDEGPLDDPLFEPHHGWNPHQGEPRSDARRRLIRSYKAGRRLTKERLAKLETQVKNYLDHREKLARLGGWKPRRSRKVSESDRWDWLVRFQVCGMTMPQIATLFHVAVSTVSDAVNDLADLIGLTLREQNHEGGWGRSGRRAASTT